MKSRQSIVALLVCLLALVWVSTATAQGNRNYWRHPKGHFENTTGNTWVEKIGDKTHRFVEKERTEKYIELYDRNRDCWVRLFSDRCMVKFPGKGDTKFKEYYEGKWGK